MTFLETLQAHKGSLIQIKSQLYWYAGHKWDNNPGRICLILDAAAGRFGLVVATAARSTAAAAALLLIDGGAQWIWVAEEDIELLVNDQPIS